MNNSEKISSYKKDNNKITKSKFVFIFIPIAIVLVIFCVIAVGLLIIKYKATINEQKRQESYDLVMSYKQETNDEGIAVDMLDNPYFMEKMDGYEYPSPKEISYYSSITNTKRHAYVILPVNYDEDKEYPVLYLMHGLHGSHKTWLNKKADIILYNLYYFNNAKEMIVVLPNSEVNEQENGDDLEFDELVKIYDKVEDDLIECLMPYINENYSTKNGKENTAIAGNSMGGRATMDIAFHHQDLFGYVGAFSSANVLSNGKYNSKMPPVLDDVVIDDRFGGFKLIMLNVGRSDDVCGICTYQLHERMVENGIEHIFYDVEGGHQNTVWQNALYNFGMRLFKE